MTSFEPSDKACIGPFKLRDGCSLCGNEELTQMRAKVRRKNTSVKVHVVWCMECGDEFSCSPKRPKREF